MRLKTPKSHSGVSKIYKVFYTKFHSAQQNKLYALIQVIHLYPYPINIVSNSLYSVFVLQYIKTSTINSNQSIIQQLFLELQSVVKNCTSLIYITHIRTHSCLPGPMAHGNEQADKLVSFATPEEQHALLHNNAGSFHQIWKIHTNMLKKSLNIALLIGPYIFDPLHKVSVLEDYNPMNYGKWI